MAIIGLVGLTHQLIEWAKVIHEITMKYVAVRELLFAWIPFHIPHEWHDPIILGTILLSVINVGFYQRTGIWCIVQLFLIFSPPFDIFTRLYLIIPSSSSDWGTSRTLRRVSEKLGNNIDRQVLICSIFGIIISTPFLFIVSLLHFLISYPHVLTIQNTLTPYEETIDVLLLIDAGVIVFFFSGALLAWRWILVTALLFGGLLAINEVYVSWLASWSG